MTRKNQTQPQTPNPSVYNGHSAFFLASAPFFVVVFEVEGIKRRVRVRGESAANQMASERNGTVEPYSVGE